MLEAMARKKASAFMATGRGEEFAGHNRPQEDMLTSAIFGSIRLLPMADQHRALGFLLGADFVREAGFDVSADIKISLWQRFDAPVSLKRTVVEPDVVLSCAGKTVIVEVKWYANLSRNQIEHQVQAVSSAGNIVSAIVVLGKPESDSLVEGAHLIHRSWQRVSADLHNARGDVTGALGYWLKTLLGALQATEMGHAFAGLPLSCSQPVDPVRYCFGIPS